MPLSRNTTAAEIWREAFRDVGAEAAAFSFERFNLINRAVQRVFDTFSGLMKDAYMDSATVTVSSVAISLSSLQIARSLAVNMSLESSATNYVDPVSISEVRTFRTGALQNLNRIVWAYAGDSLLVAKGTSIASDYGTTITLRYPRVPAEVALDATALDLPDGAPVSLATEVLKKLLSQRIKRPIDNSTDISRLVAEMHQSYGIGISNEEIEKKTQSLT